MKIVADLHIHSKYSRACSPLLVPEQIELWCRKKGIGIVGTGDFTHPAWFADMQEKLEEAKPGLYQLKSKYQVAHNFVQERQSPYFLCSAEIASIYKQGDKVRRIHNILLAPSLAAVARFNEVLDKRGINRKSDGRPIMGLHCDELVKIVKDIDPEFHVVPAHAWTPHFGVFGSLSGFDSLEEAFGDQTKYIFAIETGLSSDPKMNWQVEQLDSISLISNSDPHSLHRLGREANIFDIHEQQLSYTEVIRTIRDKNPTEFIQTIEFFPEEGRYHLDGHRDCKFSCLPEETQRRGGVCPVCGKQLLRGVLNRVGVVGTRVSGSVPKSAVPFSHTIPLEEILGECLGVGVGSKKVQALYEELVCKKTEFEYLLFLKEDALLNAVSPDLVTYIRSMRLGKVDIVPGYDGEYGKIHIADVRERVRAQKLLF